MKIKRRTALLFFAIFYILTVPALIYGILRAAGAL